MNPQGESAEKILGVDGHNLVYRVQWSPLTRGEGEAHISLFSLSGGNGREIKVKGWGRLQNLEISSDGETFYCGSASLEGTALLRIDLEGRAQVLWRQRGSFLTWGAPSPDGRHLAFSGAVQNSNLWMVEGF